jgi:ammonia channel protein AmtB
VLPFLGPRLENMEKTQIKSHSWTLFNIAELVYFLWFGWFGSTRFTAGAELRLIALHITCVPFHKLAACAGGVFFIVTELGQIQ